MYMSSIRMCLKVGKGRGEINLVCHLERCLGLGLRDPDTGIRLRVLQSLGTFIFFSRNGKQIVCLNHL